LTFSGITLRSSLNSSMSFLRRALYRTTPKEIA
jgi:hypothetical protein